MLLLRCIYIRDLILSEIVSVTDFVSFDSLIKTNNQINHNLSKNEFLK